MHKLSDVLLTLDYCDGVMDHQPSVAELALIYSVMPELLQDMRCGGVEIDSIQ